MKHRILIGFLLLLLLLCVFAPFFTTYAHMLLSAEIAQAFPGDVSGLALILQGNSVLPLAQMPGLKAVHFHEWLLIAGLILAAAGAVLAMFKRPGTLRAAAALGFAAVLPLLLFAFYIQQLDQSILLSVMLTVKWIVWLPPVLAAALFVSELLACRGLKRLPITDRGWRIISAVLCGITLCMLLFPFAQTEITPGTFATAEEDALATRSLSGWAWMVGREPLLKELADQAGLFQNPVQGGYLQSLVQLSDSAGSVTTLFKIPTYNGSSHGIVLAAALLLFAGSGAPADPQSGPLGSDRYHHRCNLAAALRNTGHACHQQRRAISGLGLSADVYGAGRVYPVPPAHGHWRGLRGRQRDDSESATPTTPTSVTPSLLKSVCGP